MTHDCLIPKFPLQKKILTFAQCLLSSIHYSRIFFYFRKKKKKLTLGDEFLIRHSARATLRLNIDAISVINFIQN